MPNPLRRRFRRPNARTAERERLLKRMPKRGVCAEIGVWKGDFSTDILRLTQPSKLYLVDPWTFVDAEGYEESFYGGARAKDQHDMDDIYRGVCERFAPQVASGTVEIWMETSEAAASRLPLGSLDWVYIDGDHTYDAVTLDLQLYGERVKPGGWITGDDYGPGGWYDGGVMRAVQDYASVAKVEVTVWGPQFLIQRPTDSLSS